MPFSKLHHVLVDSCYWTKWAIQANKQSITLCVYEAITYTYKCCTFKDHFKYLLRQTFVLMTQHQLLLGLRRERAMLYLERVPQTDDERVIDCSEKFHLRDDVLDRVLLQARLLVDVLHRENLLVRFALDQTNLSNKFPESKSMNWCQMELIVLTFLVFSSNYDLILHCFHLQNDIGCPWDEIRPK